MGREEAEEYAKGKGMLFFEASAKTADRVGDIFHEVARKMCSVIEVKPRRAEETQPKKILVQPQQGVPQQNRGGCTC